MHAWTLHYLGGNRLACEAAFEVALAAYHACVGALLVVAAILGKPHTACGGAGAELAVAGNGAFPSLINKQDLQVVARDVPWLLRDAALAAVLRRKAQSGFVRVAGCEDVCCAHARFQVGLQVVTQGARAEAGEQLFHVGWLIRRMDKDVDDARLMMQECVAHAEIRMFDTIARHVDYIK